MKNYLNILTIALAFSFLLTPQGAVAGGSGHGGESKKKEASPKKKEFEGNFSKEQLNQMRREHHLNGITSSNHQVTETAYFFFEQEGEEAVTPLLTYLQRNKNREKRVSAAIYTLGRLGEDGARAVPILSNYLKHENMDIRRTTIAALGKIGNAAGSTVPKIAEYLSAKDEWTRNLALRSLKGIGTKHSNAIASQYEKKIKLEEERKKLLLLNKKKEG